MKKLKRLLSLIMIMTLIISTMSVSAYAETKQKQEYQYIDAGGVIVKADGTAYTCGANMAGILYPSYMFVPIGGDFEKYDKEMNMLRYLDNNVKLVDADGGRLAIVTNDNVIKFWQSERNNLSGVYSPANFIDESWEKATPQIFKGYGNIVRIDTESNNFSFTNDKGETYKYDSYNDKVEKQETDSDAENYYNEYYTTRINEDGDLEHKKLGVILKDIKDEYLYSDYSPVDTSDTVNYVSEALAKNGDLYRWKFKHVYDGDDYIAYGENPVLIMQNVKECIGGIYHPDGSLDYVIKKDGSLWSWKNEGKTAEKLLDNVLYADTDGGQILAVTADGTLWKWGWLSSYYDEGTKVTYQPTKWTTGMPVYEVEPELIVEEDPAEELVLPTDKLDKVADADSAVNAVKSAAGTMTAEQKESATGVDKLTVFAEEAAANAVSTTVDNDINVTNEVVADLTAKSDEAKAKVEKAVESSGVELNRDMQQNVKIKTNSSSIKTVDFANDLSLENIDNVIIESDEYSISVPAEVIAEEDGLQMTIEALGEYTGSLDDSFLIGAANGSNKKNFKISFNKNQLKTNVKISLPTTSGNTNDQAIINSQGKAVGGKYNPTTGKLEAKINTADTYTVKSNAKDFTDISNKSAEMQTAIKTLAAKGIISGTSSTTFSPDKSISRAEIAAIILRTLGKLDANADGQFTDVKKSDWYYGTAGSSKKYGIVTGYPDGTFKGKNAIQKEQVIAVSARTLQQEMGYKVPANASTYLSRYADASSISSWATGTAALGTRENLVVQRTDGKFAPKENITRGEAALILKKLFDRVW